MIFGKVHPQENIMIIDTSPSQGIKSIIKFKKFRVDCKRLYLKPWQRTLMDKSDVPNTKHWFFTVQPLQKKLIKT